MDSVDGHFMKAFPAIHQVPLADGGVKSQIALGIGDIVGIGKFRIGGLVDLIAFKIQTFRSNPIHVSIKGGFGQGIPGQGHLVIAGYGFDVGREGRFSKLIIFVISFLGHILVTPGILYVFSQRDSHGNAFGIAGFNREEGRGDEQIVITRGLTTGRWLPEFTGNHIKQPQGCILTSGDTARFVVIDACQAHLIRFRNIGFIDIRFPR